MARHSIDRAMLAGADHGDERPSSTRWDIPDPYARRKFSLLAGICEAFAVSILGDTRGDMFAAHLFGYPSDIEAVEVLYTSLLAHATRSMAASEPIGGVRSYRSSFLLAYAARITKRLADTRRAAETAYEADTGASALPVLRDRKAEVDALYRAFLAQQEGRVTSTRPSTSGFGVKAGQAAADQADLGQSRVRGGVAGAIGTGR